MGFKAESSVLVRITHYCAGKCCCGKQASGRTASGHKVRVGGVAANRYPFGTILYIVELKRYVVVTDRTASRYGSRVDIYVPTHGADVQINYAHVNVISRGTWDRRYVHQVVSRGFWTRDKLSRIQWRQKQEKIKQKMLTEKLNKQLKQKTVVKSPVSQRPFEIFGCTNEKQRATIIHDFLKNK